MFIPFLLQIYVRLARLIFGDSNATSRTKPIGRNDIAYAAPPVAGACTSRPLSVCGTAAVTCDTALICVCLLLLSCFFSRFLSFFAKMGLCSVYGCTNSHKKCKDMVPKVHFYCYPSGKYDQKRREAWIRFAKRKK